MKLKEKIKRFWTLSMERKGFTLVELIVVIAILAILAGVAIPVYNGYIKKAESAADQQLLDTINTAFTAACLLENIPMETLTETTALMPISADKKVVVASIRPAEVRETFASFYAENEDVAFGTFNSLVYNPVNRAFEASDAEGTRVVAYGGGYIQISEKAISALKNSSFYGDGMTSEKLLNQMDTVAGIAGLMGSVQSVMATEEYVATALSALGIESSGDFAEDSAKLQERATQLALREMGLNDISEVTEAKSAEFANICKNISDNALVIYTAQSAASMSTNDAKELLKNLNSTTIYNNMTSGTSEQKQNAMSQAALAYGMYYAYVNSDACTDPNLKGKTDIVANDVTTALDSDPNFQQFISGSQSDKDMEAYLAALGVINSSTESTEAVEKLVVDGFATSDLIAILTQNMGK